MIERKWGAGWSEGDGWGAVFKVNDENLFASE